MGKPCDLNTEGGTLTMVHQLSWPPKLVTGKSIHERTSREVLESLFDRFRRHPFDSMIEFTALNRSSASAYVKCEDRKGPDHTIRPNLFLVLTETYNAAATPLKLPIEVTTGATEVIQLGTIPPSGHQETALKDGSVRLSLSGFCVG